MKSNKKTDKGKKYERPASLYPLDFEVAVKGMFETKSPKKEDKKKKNQD